MTLRDHQVRLQQLTCCIANKGNELALKLRSGMDCCQDRVVLETLVAVLNTLCCYNPEEICYILDDDGNELADDYNFGLLRDTCE